MSGFYYFVPNGKTSIGIADLSSLGLGYAMENRHTARGCTGGPGGSHGVVVCHGDNRDGRLGYFPDKQMWKQIPGCDVWCGCYSEAKPTPEQLSRSTQLDGVWITLDDGNKWLAPTARRLIEQDDVLYPVCTLPRKLKLDEEGQWVPGDVKARYASVWDMAMQYEKAFYEAQINQEPDANGRVTITFEEPDALAVSALQLNYRVSDIEMDILGVYDYEARQKIVNALLDNGTWEAWVKKKNAEQAQCGGTS